VVNSRRCRQLAKESVGQPEKRPSYSRDFIAHLRFYPARWKAFLAQARQRTPRTCVSANHFRQLTCYLLDNWLSWVFYSISSDWLERSFNVHLMVDHGIFIVLNLDSLLIYFGHKHLFHHLYCRYFLGNIHILL